MTRDLTRGVTWRIVRHVTSTDTYKHADLGRKIKAARNASGLSHDKLAEKVGTSRRHLIKLEHGMHRPGPEMLAKIAEATGQPLELSGDDEDDESAMREKAELFDALAGRVADIIAERQRERSVA